MNTKETQKALSSSSTLDGNYKADETPIETENSIENMGLAVFNGDKLVGELDNIETLCYAITSNNLQNATITIQNPYDYNSYLSIYIWLTKDTKNNVKIINDYPYISSNVSVSGYVLSLDDSLDLSDAKTLGTLNTAVSSYLEYCINNYLYKTSKSLHSDINNFGIHVLHKYLTNDEWLASDWLNNYQNAFFDVNVETNIISRIFI